ncbi:unnamed protein product [Rotaria socialis]|uniref:Beta-lactamase-related domain-containing protein n=1 Tax=Rotaria socialis TaxID=392032 RepID=A0A820NLH4_9BILA|nr:unnamed protein product [Rotaria socialis]
MGNTVRAKLFKIREKKKAKQHSRWIDRQIQSDLTKKKSEIKCLVSGIYGSGKTTLIHHMDLIYNPNLLNEEILECRKRIYMEVFRSLIAIIQEMKKDQCLKLKFLSYSYPDLLNFSVDIITKSAMDRINSDLNYTNSYENIDLLYFAVLDNLLWHANLSNNGCKLPSEISNALKRLWSDVDIKIWYKQHKDRLDSCHHFFLKRLMEILNDNYTPVEQDILHAGNTTKNNLNEVKCQLDTGITIWLIDVYTKLSYTSNANRWLNYFIDAPAIINIVDLSCYDQVDHENGYNPMQESIAYFHSLCRAQWLRESTIFLCLNKKDIFASKITHSSLRGYSPDYTGRDDYNEAAQYILSQFLQMNTNEHMYNIYPLFTLAIDPESVRLLAILLLAIILLAIDAINGSKHHASQTIKSTKQDHAIEFMIDEVINTAMKTQKIPGVALGVFRRGEIIFSKVYGYSNLEHEVPVKLETMFQSGSVGKQFTSMAIMMLVEHEKLQLDDKIQKYFHDAPIEWANITIRNLLTHTSGMVSYSPDLNFQQAYTEDDVYNIIKSTTLIYQPGQQFSYSNFGYIMLGFLIQRVTNQSYANFIHEHIFRPLGMKTARIINETSIIPNRASGYVFIDDHIINQPWVSPIFNTMADGSFYFNIYDMVKWDEALYSDVLLKRQASFDEMWSPVKLNGNITYEYGFGWSLLEAINGMRIIEHGGSWQGFRTMIVRVPEDERTVFLFTNMNRPTVDVRKIAHDVLHIYNAQLAVKPIFDYQSQ